MDIDKKKLKVKKLKKPPRPWLFQKGFNPRTLMTKETRCKAYTKNGVLCSNFRVRGGIYCWRHGTVSGPGKLTPFNLYKEVFEKLKIRKNDKKYSLADYPQMVQIYQDTHLDITIMKSSQEGITEWALLDALVFLSKHKGTSCIYTLPSRGLASSVSKQRIDSIFNDNPGKFIKRDKKTGKVISKYDSVFEKQIIDSFIFLQGTWIKRQAIAIPADMLIHDEVDQSKKDVMGIFRSRLSNSDYKIIRKFSTPTYPEFGIHREFLKTDQHHWWHRCEHCGFEFKLCCSWPDILQFDEETNRPFYGCTKCYKEIERTSGWWKADEPHSKKRGYHVTQLSSPRKSAADLLEAKDDYENEKDFINFELGLPYEGGDNQLTIVDVERCEDENYILGITDKFTAAGVDQGGKDLWITVVKPMTNRMPLIFVDHLSGKNCWNELHLIFKRLGVRRCIIDGLPDSFKAGEFQEEHKGVVYLAYYQLLSKEKRSKPSEFVHWQQKKGMVTINRTDSFDSLLQKIKNRRFIFPVSDKLFLFKKHLTSLIKIKVVDKDGESRYEYKKVRQDHFAHSLNYATIAASKMDMKSLGIYNAGDNARRIEQGKFSDVVLNILANLVIDSKIRFDGIIIYRASKLDGKFVSEMDLPENEKQIFGKLELEHTVRNLLESTMDLMAIKLRIELVEERKLDELLKGGTDGSGITSDALS